jgi:hypothetical protein
VWALSGAAAATTGTPRLELSLLWRAPADAAAVRDAALQRLLQSSGTATPVWPPSVPPSPLVGAALGASTPGGGFIPSAAPGSGAGTPRLSMSLGRGASCLAAPAQAVPARLRRHDQAFGCGVQRLRTELPRVHAPLAPGPAASGPGLEGGEILPQASLSQALDLFTRAEQLDSDNAWQCAACGRRGRGMTSTALWHAPELLFVALKRFTRDRKVTEPVDFPLEGLDLGPWVRGPTAAGAVYDLCGVVNHAGGLGGGHYTATVRHRGGPGPGVAPGVPGGVSGDWYEISDERVRRLPAGAPRDAVVTSAAYVLCFARRQTARYAAVCAAAEREARAATGAPARRPPLPRPALLLGARPPAGDWELEQATGLAAAPLPSLRTDE